MNNSEPIISPEEIAIIGMAGRFPGASNLDEFWRNLCGSVESISIFSEEELAESGIDPQVFKSPHYVNASAILDGADLFDASFFGFSPREAEVMDPQQRVFLEVSWEALENAGHDADSFSGLIGIYGGLSTSTYLYNIFTNTDLIGSVGRLSIILGNDKDHLPLRASYKLNLKGPSVNVNTACSTSLVAVHLACQSLLVGECDAALAGGITITVPQKAGYVYEEEGLLSPDGHCRAFDARAKGTVTGNGIGVVVLRRLSDALAAGDNIHAIIKASAVNNDGAMRMGYTAPSVEGQAGVIADALALARVSPETIRYIEAHGSGTALGDAIELSALNEVFRAQTSARGFCAIGSVKTNIGHLDSAAGVAGLIKTVLSLKNKMIPASLNYETPNPKLNIEDTPFYVNTKLSQWEASDVPRRAGVSSFGLGGTNAHIILEESPERAPSSPSRPWNLIVLSAKSEASLEESTERLAQHLKRYPDQNPSDIAYTYQLGRKQFEHRRIIVGLGQQHLLRTLDMRDPKFFLTSICRSGDRPVTFMFPGLGDHYVNMAAELYKNESIFKETIEYCSQLLKSYNGLDLTAALYPQGEEGAITGTSDKSDVMPDSTIDLRRMLRRGGGSDSKTATELDRTILAQPALFAIEYALASLLMSWGIKPESMIGYSIGEYVAACLSGVISFEDAFYLVARRAEIIESLPGGDMLAIPASEEELSTLLRDGISISAINTPSLCIVSGARESIHDLEQQLSRKGLLCRKVQTTHAFHSSMMEPAFDLLVKEVQRIKLKPPSIPYISNVTGYWITEAQATAPTYWAQHMCAPVRFGDGIAPLLENQERVFLEVGPGHSLCSTLLQHPLSKQHDDLTVVASLRHQYEKQSDEAFILTALGKLWLAGVEPDWTGLYPGERRYRVPLPTYSFESKRYWIESNRVAGSAAKKSSPGALIPDMADWFSIPTWKLSVYTDIAKGDKSEMSARNRLVFVGKTEFAEELVRRLKEIAHCVNIVRAGSEFSRSDDGSYTIDPHRKEHYDQLVESLIDADNRPDHIVHLWNVTGESEPASRSRFRELQSLGIYSLLFLVQSLAKKEIAHSLVGDVNASLNIDVITDNMQPVTGSENLFPEKAVILGPCKTIPQEYPNLTCRSIDIELPRPGSWQEQQLADRLLTEFNSPSEELAIAFRGVNRWVQTFEPLRIEGSEPEPERLRKNGVYWITGGLGRDSLVRAKYLAEKHQARLILTGRTALPPKSEWDNWIATHDNRDEISEKIRKVIELEKAGSEVLVMSADVADQEQMQMVVRAIDERFGELHGVIHAAGLTDVKYSQVISEVEPGECERHFQSKVYGCYVLENVLRGRPLDFCILTSSVASMTGGVGVLAYTSASIFMDTFAHRHNRVDPVCWTSLNWQGVSDEETIEAFRRVLSLRPVTQLIVSPEDLVASINRRIHLDFLRKSSSGQTVVHSRPNLGNDYVAPRNDIERRLSELWQQLIGIDQVGIHDNFLELGGDSLLGVQLIARLRNIFKINLSVRSLFESPTIAELALTIEELLIEEIELMTEEEAKRFK